MPVVNADIADQLREVADLLDIDGDDPFRVRAYRRAARLIAALPNNVSEMVANGQDLEVLPGIGKSLAAKIAGIVRGEHQPLLDRLAGAVPASVRALLALPGLGPRRVHLLYENLDIDTIDKLAAAVRAGKLRNMPGFGPKLEAKLLRVISEGSRQSR